MSEIKLQKIVKLYESGIIVVKGIDFTVKDREFVALVAHQDVGSLLFYV